MLDADLGQTGNAGGEVYPGYPGLVVADGALQAMTWGFPLQRRGNNGQPLKPKPINNTRDDKLDSPFWRSSFVHRRCLIPMEAFAEAEGEAGAKTRTWFSMPNAAAFTCAGIWRDSAEWGRSYSLIMTEASEQVSVTHDRMPVLVTKEHRELWLSGSLETARSLCRPYLGELRIEATDQRWTR